MSLDSSGYQKPIHSCDMMKFVENFKQSCKGESSPYNLINDNGKDKIGSLQKKFSLEISNMYSKFKSTDGPLIDKTSISSKCNFSDRSALQVSNSIKSIKLGKYLNDNKELLNNSIGKSLAEILFDNNSLSETIDFDKHHLLSDPYFREILSMNNFDENMLSNLPLSLTQNNKIQSTIANKLAAKCKQTYDSAINALCKSDKNKSILSYRAARSNLKENKKIDVLKQAQYLDFLCSEPEMKDISINIKDMNNSLPPSQIKLKGAEAITDEQYRYSYSSVRETVCEFIPDQVSSYEEGLKKMGCTDGNYKEECLYLESYAKLFSMEQEGETNQSLGSLGINNSNKSSNRKYYNKFSKPSKLVASFIGQAEEVEPEETNSKSKIEKTSKDKVVSKIASNKATTKKKSRVSTAVNSKRTKSKVVQVGQPTQTSNQNYAATQYSFDDRQEKEEMNEFYKGLADKIDRIKKNKRSIASTASDSTNSKSVDRATKLFDRSKKNLREAKDILKNIASSSTSTDQYDEDLNDQVGQYDSFDTPQEMIEAHHDVDRGIASVNLPSKGYSGQRVDGNKGLSNKGTPLSAESVAKGYAYQNIFGDTVAKQGVEAHYIENKGFQGEIVGDKALEFVFLGELEQDPDKINLEEILTLDSSKGNVDSLLVSIDTGKPFFIRSASSPNERILVKPSNGDFEFIKYSDDDSKEFHQFYRKVKKAFKKKFYAKIQSKNSVVSASGY